MQQDSGSNLKLDLQTNSTRFNVLVGLTGSVAALKAPLLVTQLLEIPGVSVYSDSSNCIQLCMLEADRATCPPMLFLFHTFVH